MSARRRHRIFRFVKSLHKHQAGAGDRLKDGELYICAGEISKDYSEYVRLKKTKVWGIFSGFERGESVQCYDFGLEELPTGFIKQEHAYKILAGEKVLEKHFSITDSPIAQFYASMIEQEYRNK